MTDREQKLQKALEWLINLIEDAVNKTDDYCKEKCPVRDHDRLCPAESMRLYEEDDRQWDWERDYQKCMELQVDWYVENANRRR